MALAPLGNIRICVNLSSAEKNTDSKFGWLWMLPVNSMPMSFSVQMADSQVSAFIFM